MIGGGADSPLIFNKMIELVGGKENARIAIIPSSDLHSSNSIPDYEKYFITELNIPKQKVL